MMKRIAVASLSLVAWLTLPGGLSAQRAGFQVGLAPGSRPPIVAQVRAGQVLQPFVTPQPFGAVVQPAQLTPQGQVVRRGARTVGRGVQIQQRGGQIGGPYRAGPASIAGRRGIRRVQRGNRIARQGQVVFVRPQIAGVVRERLPQHPVATPGVTVIAPRGRNPFTGVLGLGVSRLPRGVPAPNFGTRQRVRTSGNGALIGVTRADVIRQFGRPSATIINSGGETLIFGGTTVIIQNGQVAIVQ